MTGKDACPQHYQPRRKSRTGRLEKFKTRSSHRKRRQKLLLCLTDTDPATPRLAETWGLNAKPRPGIPGRARGVLRNRTSNTLGKAFGNTQKHPGKQHAAHGNPGLSPHLDSPASKTPMGLGGYEIRRPEPPDHPDDDCNFAEDCGHITAIQRLPNGILKTFTTR